MKTTIFRFLLPLTLLAAALVAYATDFTGSTKPLMEDPALTLQQKAVRSQYDLQQALIGIGTNSLRTTATMTLGNTNVGATILNTVPVTGTFWPDTQPVSGTVTANLGNTNVGATVLNSVGVTGTFWPETQPVSGTFWQGTQPVSGTFWQATQAVSGTVTANLGNTNVGATVLNTVPVTGIFWPDTQPVSGSVTATLGNTNVGATVLNIVPVTGTFWQATQPVSGTVTANLGSTNVGATVLNTPTVNLNSDTNQVKLAGTLPAFAATPTVNAAQSGAWTVTGAGGTFPVTGNFWQATQPVSGTFWQATQPVSGTVTANLGNTNVGATVLNTVPVTGTFYQATQPVSLATAPTTPVTGTFWQATQPVSGAVTATLGNTNVGATVLNTVPVTGSFYQTTQPVSGTVTASGPVTDTQLRATAVPVSLASLPSHAVTGSFYQTTQPVSLATAPTTPVTGNFWQATQPVSGTFWQVTQPVSGTVTATGPVTDTQLRATAVPVSIASVPSHAVTLASTTITGSAAVTGTFWQTTQPVSLATAPTTPVTGAFWQATQPVSGTVTASGPVTDTQLRATAVPVSIASVPSHAVTLASTTITGSAAVTGTFWQTTQPVSLATAPTTPVTGTFWQTTQPVSGTVTANLGNTNVGATVLNVPGVVIAPSAFTLNIAAVGTSYQLTGGNLIRMLNFYNTNAGSIYVMFGTNAGFAFEVATNANSQWSAPAGMVLYDTNIWFRGATGVVNGVTFK